jgi:hypothetical protein
MIESMPSLALCISGHFRDFEIAWPYLRRNLLDDYQPDIFGMAWSDSMGHATHARDKSDPNFEIGYDPAHAPVTDRYIDSVCQRLNPRMLKMLDPASMRDRFARLCDEHRNLEPEYWLHRSIAKYQMLTAREVVINIKQDYERANGFVYDRVIYTRWDIVHEQRLANWILTDPRIIMSNRYTYGGPSDQWASGSSAQMDIWCSLLKHLPEVKHRPDFKTHPHTWIKDQLDHFGIEYILCDLPIMIANRPFRFR